MKLAYLSRICIILSIIISLIVIYPSVASETITTTIIMDESTKFYFVSNGVNLNGISSIKISLLNTSLTPVNYEYSSKSGSIDIISTSHENVTTQGLLEIGQSIEFINKVTVCITDQAIGVDLEFNRVTEEIAEIQIVYTKLYLGETDCRLKYIESPYLISPITFSILTVALILSSFAFKAKRSKRSVVK
jgi:hypothetical protein